MVWPQRRRLERDLLQSSSSKNSGGAASATEAPLRRRHGRKGNPPKANDPQTSLQRLSPTTTASSSPCSSSSASASSDENSCHGKAVVSVLPLSLGCGRYTDQGLVEDFVPLSVRESSNETSSASPTSVASNMAVKNTSLAAVTMESSSPSLAGCPDIVKSPTERTSSRDEDDSSCDEENENGDNVEDDANDTAERSMNHISCFLRVADLNPPSSTTRDEGVSNTLTQRERHAWTIQTSLPNAATALVRPTTSTQKSEVWAFIPAPPPVAAAAATVSSDEGSSSQPHSRNNNGVSQCPTMTSVVDSLASYGLDTLMNANMWTPEGKTRQLVSAASSSWEGTTFETPSFLNSTNSSTDQQTTSSSTLQSPHADHVLVWTGSFTSGHYGSDIPAIRSAAVIQMSAAALVDLLTDSSRVKEYNSMSLGRHDTHIWESAANDDEKQQHHSHSHSSFRTLATKVMRSESRPPMLRKTLQFNTLFHVRHYTPHDEYLLVSRAVTVAPQALHSSSNTTDAASTVVSEIMLGVNFIRKLDDDNTCLLTTVNHIYSPLVPLMIAKRLGLQAAVNFIHDVRKCC